MKAFSRLQGLSSILAIVAVILAGCDDPATKPKKEKGWAQAGTELTQEYIQCMIADPLRPSFLYVGTIDGIFASADQGASWQEINNGLDNHDIKAIAVAADQPDLLYCATWGRGLYSSADRGRQWLEISSLAPKLIGAILLQSDRSDTLWAGASEGIYSSYDRGQTWYRRWQSGGRRVMTLAALSGQDQIILAGIFLIGFVRTADGGTVWNYSNTGIRGTPGASDCATFFATGAAADGSVYATSAGGFVYVSTDSGLTWQSRMDDLTWQTCIGLVRDPRHTGRLYMAMQNGKVYRSDDRGSTWAMVGEQIANVTAALLYLQSGVTNTLYVGTSGQGLYRYEE